MKEEIGRFLTIKYKLILKFLDKKVPPYIEKIIEPFAGKGHLLKILKNVSVPVEKYDLIPFKNTIKRDTILNPPNYKNSFIITNPPFLAKNKSKNKIWFENSPHDDLYKCFLQQLIDDNPEGGILILPLNFLSSSRNKKIRRDFFTCFSVKNLNIFTIQTFENTTIPVIAFRFKCINSSFKYMEINTRIFGEEGAVKKIIIILYQKYDYLIGGELYNLSPSPFQRKYKFLRLIDENKIMKKSTTRIVIKTIDPIIQAEFIKNKRDVFVDKTHLKSARTFMTIVCYPPLDVEKQKILVKKFNKFLEKKRKYYHSLFLTSYREFERKRITFGMVYSILGYLVEKYN